MKMDNQHMAWGRARFVLGLAASSFAACAGDSAGGGSLDTLPNDLAQVMCKRAYECCTTAELSSSDLTGPNEASCRTNLAGLLSLGFGQQKQSIAKMRVAYHADAASACIAAINSATCAQLESDEGPTGAAACNGIFEPKVPTGAACTADSECIGGGACDGGDSQTNTDGVCRAVAGTGDKCGGSSDCADGSYCDSSAKTCAVKKADGAMCAYSTECRSGQCTMGMCMKKPGDGQCFINSSCAVASGPVAWRDTVPAAMALGLAALWARRRRRR